MSESQYRMLSLDSEVSVAGRVAMQFRSFSFAGPPKVLHYGNELAINNITYYEFNKIDLKANKFNPLECPPWTQKDGKFTSGLLPFPPSPLSFTTKVTPVPQSPASE